MITADNWIVQFFNTGFNGSIPAWVGNILLVFLSILMASICSGVIGIEREYNGHAAGLRTHLLVSLGSAIVMIISIYGFGGGYSNRDPARLAAQVVSGIGFLGAGTIVQTGTDVKGLTTATTLWISMAIGLAAGSGNFILAAASTLLTLAILIFVKRAEKIVNRKNPIITLVVPSDKPVMKEVILVSQRYGLTVRETYSELVSFEEDSALRITLRVSCPSSATLTAFTDEIRFTIRPLELKVSSDPQ